MKKQVNGNAKKKVNKKTKKKLSKKGRIITYTISSVIIIAILITLYSLVIEATDVYTLEEGTLYLEEASVGYIIRDEVIVKGENYKNGIIQIASEGQRVSKTEEIFRYYSKTEDEITQKIEDINIKLQEAISKEDIIFPTDIKNIDNEINEKTKKLNTLTNTQEIEEYKKEINSLISKKSQIIGENSKSGSYIKDLMNQKQAYEKELSENSEYMSAPISGTMSYRVDGLESILTPNCFDALTAKYLNELNLKTGKMIATSNEEGKVIDNFYCYIATVLNSDKAKEAEVGQNLTLRILNDKEIPAQIEYINKADENNIIIVFKINKSVDELINYRKIDFDVIWWSESGLKVPNQSILKDENGLNYVIRNRSGYLDKMIVKVLKSNDTHSIISPYKTEELKEIGYDNIYNYKKITLYDEIVLNPTADMIDE